MKGLLFLLLGLAVTGQARVLKQVNTEGRRLDFRRKQMLDYLLSNPPVTVTLDTTDGEAPRSLPAGSLGSACVADRDCVDPYTRCGPSKTCETTLKAKVSMMVTLTDSADVTLDTADVSSSGTRALKQVDQEEKINDVPFLPPDDRFHLSTLRKLKQGDIEPGNRPFSERPYGDLDLGRRLK